MNYLRILRVQIIERVAKLIGPANNFILRKRSVAGGQHLRQILARDVLHYEKLSVALVEMIADARQRRMVHPRQQPRFPLELLAQFLFRKKGLLQRDRRVQSLINCLVHGAHAALSELAHDAITAL